MEGGVQLSRRYGKLLALLVVAIFVISPLTFATQLVEDDAGGSLTAGYGDIPLGSDYGYKLHFDDNNVAITKVEASTGGGAYQDVSRIATETGFSMNPFWSFNNQGLGPFNTFYAAINITTQEYIDDGCPEPRISYQAGHIAYVLAPNNLAMTLKGNTFNTDYYNIVLVVPTVYWYSDETNKVLYMTNVKDYFDDSINGKLMAYAHTFYDKTKGKEVLTSHIGLGVYLSSLVTASDVGGSGDVQEYMVSQPDRAPAGGKSVNTYNTYTQNLEKLGGSGISSDYQAWNFYQWTLYKMMGYTMLGTKNSQMMLPNGNQNPYSSIDYTGKSQDFPIRGGFNVSLLIQNPYGPVKWEGLSDVYVSSDRVLHIGNNLNPGDLGSSTSGIINYDISSLSDGWISETSAASNLWDLPIASSPTEGKTIDDVEDYVKGYRGNNSNCVVVTGDGWSRGGMANVVFDTNIKDGAWYHRSRLVVIFDSGEATITYKAGEGTGADYQQIFQKGIVQRLTPFDSQFEPPSGKEFAGWKYQSGGNTYTVQDQARIAIATDQVFEAIWAQNIFTVSFDSNGGSAVSPQKIMKGGFATDPATTIPPSSPTRAGYILDGWYSDSLLTSRFDFSTTPIIGDITLHAKWLDAVTVTFDSNGGSRVDDITIVKNTALPVYPTPTRSGYYFEGWFKDPDQQEFFQPNTSVTDDTRLYAKWSSGVTTTYTVTFDTDVTGVYVAKQTVNSGEKAVQPERPARDNHTFLGWYLGDVLYTFDEAVTQNITLKARWSEWGYTVKFDVNSTGGVSIAEDMSVGMARGAQLPTEDQVWRSGYELKGWCKDKNSTSGTFVIEQNNP